MMMQPTNTLNSSPREDKVDLKVMVYRFRPYWYIFVICLILGAFGAHMVNNIKSTVYLVKSTLLIQQDRTAMPYMRDMEFFANKSNVNNEIAILESFTVIDSALRKMDAWVNYYETKRVLGFWHLRELYRDSPFKVEYEIDHPQPFGELISLEIIDENWYKLNGVKGVPGLDEEKQYFFGQKVQGNGFNFTITREVPFRKEVHGEQSYQFIIFNPEHLSAIYKSFLTIEPLGTETSIFEVSFKATNLQRANDFVNTLINTFLDKNLREKNQTAENTVNFIERQIALTAGNLNATEGRLQDFREKEQLMDVGAMGAKLVDELQVLDKERSIVEVKHSYYDFLLEYVSDRRDFSEVFGPSALGIEDPMLNNLLVELSRLHTERGRLLLTTTERSPSVLAIDQNITQVKATLEENIKNIQAASSILMTDLNRRIRRIEQRINQLPSTERELIGIQRMFNITDATYNFLLEKQAEAGIALASNMSDHKIVDQSRYISAVAPMRTLNYAIGLVLGLGLPFIIISLRDGFNTRIVNKDQIARAVNFPIIGIVPRHKPLLKNDGSVVIFDDPYSPVTESFRNIRSNLHFFSPKKNNNLIVVTSTRAGEGKTVTAINLAAVMAMANKRTLYIDADIRKLKPNKYTSKLIDVGLSNYLIGRSGLIDIINTSRHSNNLDIMPSGVIPPNPAELIESPEMMRLLMEELNHYEYIIVDTSPVGLVADAKSLMAVARLNLFVVRHNYSQYSDLEFINEYKRQANLKNMVIVMNDVKQSDKGYGHGYGLGYGNRYGAPSGNKTKMKLSRLTGAL